MPEAVEFTEGTWRQPDMMAFEAFVTGRLPSVRCPEHGDAVLTPSWASDHASLRDLIRDASTDPLNGSGRAGAREGPFKRSRVDHCDGFRIGLSAGAFRHGAPPPRLGAIS
jgi:hypothetical protein